MHLHGCGEVDPRSYSVVNVIRNTTSTPFRGFVPSVFPVVIESDGSAVSAAPPVLTGMGAVVTAMWRWNVAHCRFFRFMEIVTSATRMDMIAVVLPHWTPSFQFHPPPKRPIRDFALR